MVLVTKALLAIFFLKPNVKKPQPINYSYHCGYIQFPSAHQSICVYMLISFNIFLLSHAVRPTSLSLHTHTFTDAQWDLNTSLTVMLECVNDDQQLHYRCQKQGSVYTKALSKSYQEHIIYSYELCMMPF